MMLKAIFIVLISSLSLFAQQHDHSGHDHGDSNYELGISLGVSRLVDENENNPSAHLHLLRKLGSEKIFDKISLGFGFEYIFSKHVHYSILGTISINPYSSFKLDISPGVLVTEHEKEMEQQFVTHIELTYEFNFHGIGIGPVIGYGFAKEDNHVTVGLHLGFGL